MEHHLEFGRFRYREAATAGCGEGVTGTFTGHYKPATHNKIQHFRELLDSR